MSHDVFISYSSKDKPTADAVCAVLERQGLRCWMAPRDILPGREWGEAIIDAINDARAFVLVFSSHANASQQIKREVERAVHRGLPLIPVRIEDVAPTKSLEYFISTPHWLDAFSPPLERHLEHLGAVIAQLLDGKDRAPAPSPAPPKTPPITLTRRHALWGGAGALAAGSAWMLLGRSAGPPRFVGSWQLVKFEAKDGALAPGAPTFATDVFARAGFAGPDVSGTFSTDTLNQYTYWLAVEDRGSVVASGGQATFRSDITTVAHTFAVTVTPAAVSGAIAAAIGGLPGEGTIALGATPPVLTSVLAGRPTEPSGRDIAAIAGRWHVDVAASATNPELHVALEVSREGRYRFRGESRESGLWRAEEGQWTRTPSGGPAVSGTYVFEGQDRVTFATSTGTTTWRRGG